MTASEPFRRPLLTIAIPTVNRARLVKRALESALAQTSQEIEIIVSDNGSVDETPEVLSRYTDPRLRHLRRENTVSATTHGNLLIEQARGEFFLGLSDDDYIESDFAAQVIDLLRRRPDLSFVYTGCLVHYGPVIVPALTGPEVESGSDFITAFYTGEREVCWCACATRIADLRAIGDIPEGRIFGDMFYWTKLAFRGSVGCVSAPLAHYTFLGDNLSSGVTAFEWASETRMLADEVLAAHDNAGADGRARETLRRHCEQFVARATANQLVWNAVRGHDWRALVRYLRECWRFYSQDPRVWPRVASAVLVPRPMLRSMILRAAARRAHTRAGTMNAGLPQDGRLHVASQCSERQR